MLSLDLIRRDPERVKRAGELKGEPAPVDEILKLDELWREHQHKAETIKAEQNRLSKEFAKTRDEGLKDRLRGRADQAKEELTQAEAGKRERDGLLLQGPKRFDESGPVGKSADGKLVGRGGRSET